LARDKGDQARVTARPAHRSVGIRSSRREVPTAAGARAWAGRGRRFTRCWDFLAVVIAA
jgi:hypothetical protein